VNDAVDSQSEAELMEEREEWSCGECDAMARTGYSSSSAGEGGIHLGESNSGTLLNECADQLATRPVLGSSYRPNVLRGGVTSGRLEQGGHSELLVLGGGIDGRGGLARYRPATAGSHSG
jgi:hypothetical protein